MQIKYHQRIKSAAIRFGMGVCVRAIFVASHSAPAEHRWQFDILAFGKWHRQHSPLSPTHSIRMNTISELKFISVPSCAQRLSRSHYNHFQSASGYINCIHSLRSCTFKQYMTSANKRNCLNCFKCFTESRIEQYVGTGAALQHPKQPADERGSNI